MSSFFDVPAGLLFVLSLAASSPDATGAEISKALLPEKAATLNEAEGGCTFSRQAWLRSLKNGAGGALFSGWSDRICKTSSGRYYVPVASEKQNLMNLRRDPAMSCFVALSAAMKNVGLLQLALGRAPDLTDLYLAHMIGPDRAAAILKAAQAAPSDLLEKQFPNLDLVMPHVGALYLRKITNKGFVTELRHVTRKVEVAGQVVASHSALKSPTIAKPETQTEPVRWTLATFNPRFQLTRMPLQALGYSPTANGLGSGSSRPENTNLGTVWSTHVHRRR